MMSARLLPVLAATAVLGLSGCAQFRPGHAAHHPGAPAGAATPGKSMAHMDDHMKAMRDMQDRMKQARTPAERSALMAEHTRLMQDGMGMMGGMQSPGAGAPTDPAARQQMMEKRMEMMQSMMQMMMDRLPPSPPTP